MKKPKLKTLRRKLKKIFSEYIRLRDSNPDGIGICITCNKPLHWKKANAGHFVAVGSATQGTEYDERNVNFQCVACNNWGLGKGPEYSLFMERKYGKGIIEELVKQSKWSLIKFVNTTIPDGKNVETTHEAYEQLISYYSLKLEAIK